MRHALYRYGSYSVLLMLAVGVIFLASCGGRATSTPGGANQAGDSLELATLRHSYNQAWLTGKPEAVLSYLTDDAVIMPHHGEPIREGKEEIRAFWFPEGGPPMQVTTFESTIDEAEAHGRLGYVRGRFKLVFTYDGVEYTSEGNFLDIADYRGDSWYLHRLTWNDPLLATREVGE